MTGEIANQRQSISCEDDLQSFLETGMEEQGWRVIREVSPHNSNVRADLIANHDKVGWIGIECKFVTSGPIVIPQTIRQVYEKYYGKRYLGNQIDLWGIALYGTEHHNDCISDISMRDKQARYSAKSNQYVGSRTANGFGLGWVDIRSGHIFMKYQVSGREYHVPLLTENREMNQYFDQVDPESIRDLMDGRQICV